MAVAAQASAAAADGLKKAPAETIDEGNTPSERALIDDAADSMQLQRFDSAHVPQSHKVADREFTRHALGLKIDEGNIADRADSAFSAAAVANVPAPVPVPAPTATAAASAAAAADDNHGDDAAADDVKPPPAGIDQEVWRALPPELRAELAELSAEQLEASEHNE